ncbi:dual specificity protein phosphatase 19 [Diachasma alloeum]|uniref:dual specificity protein phosphatase 19 n=1 Tax=Diachasma alloeum TaxID=454923 RepID=UPI0007383789|nr:dual specificity protein phosphatase 19 [Diachasma alloeum]
MDFSSQIKNRKKSLKPTKTILTNYLGEKFQMQGETAEKLGEGFSFVVDDKPDLQVVKVAPGVFLSSQDPVFSLEILKENDIKSILSLGIEPDVKFPSISYSFVEILDIPEFRIADALVECLKVIRNHRDENILVHCNAGVSRSPTVVIAYLMREVNLSFQEAFDKVKRARPCVRPNEGFVKQLKELETKKGMRTL